MFKKMILPFIAGFAAGTLFGNKAVAFVTGLFKKGTPTG
jgi:hypothetical protein